jgi:hypothetical protein
MNLVIFLCSYHTFPNSISHHFPPTSYILLLPLSNIQILFSLPSRKILHPPTILWLPPKAFTNQFPLGGDKVTSQVLLLDHIKLSALDKGDGTYDVK